jgi:predicted metal-dependent enzyme (double-stranded beta helix superfamily)
MTTLTERTTAWRDAAARVHAIEVSGRPEADRLSDIRDVLVDLAAQPEVFPPSAFPRAEGSSGGLYRLAHAPDGRGGIYVSLGFTGRGGGQPHTHASWAAVVGVSGGTETNFIYEKTAADSFDLKDTVVVGPGDAILLPTGAYHTIEVVSDTPVLHVHAYGERAERPGFQPPLPAVGEDEARAEAAAGRLIVLALDGDVRGFVGPHVLATDRENAIDVLADLSADPELPVVLLSDDDDASNVTAAKIYEQARPIVLRVS